MKKIFHRESEHYAYVEISIQRQSEDPKLLIRRNFFEVTRQQLLEYAATVGEIVVKSALQTEKERFAITVLISDGIIVIKKLVWLGVV